MKDWRFRSVVGMALSEARAKRVGLVARLNREGARTGSALKIAETALDEISCIDEAMNHLERAREERK